jgi:hypothetical protein
LHIIKHYCLYRSLINFNIRKFTLYKSYASKVNFSNISLFPSHIFIDISSWIPTPRLQPIEVMLQNKTMQLHPPPQNIPKPNTTKIPLPPKPNPIPVIAPTPQQHAQHIKEEIASARIFPHEIPEIKTGVGKLGLMQPNTFAFTHVATPLLNSYASDGHPVDCGPDWSREHIELLLLRGPHRSSTSKAAIQQLRSETTTKIQHGYARIVKWSDIKNNIPKKLKISPVAMIPHKSKKFRCILDLTFKLFTKGKSFPSVNETTNKLAKAEAMVQLGNSLRRLIAKMADNYNKEKPFVFAKLDIKDGFWRCAVNDTDAWNFCYVLPSLNKNIDMDDIELVVPNSLQMGWCESPPFFCSSSETARDIIETLLLQDKLPAHKFENTMLEEMKNHYDLENTTERTTILEVFVDDFIGMTNDRTEKYLSQISRAMLHGIHSIFPPPSMTGHDGGDPISEKKLKQGDGTWSTTKEILGWEFDGDAYTIQLPQQKCRDTISLIKKLLKQKRSSLNKYQKVAGKLQHASYGLPGGKGLFSPIQIAMSGNPDFITLTKDLIIIFKDWQRLLKHMQKKPTSVLQLMANYPDYIGYSDACRLGAGGAWCSGLKPMAPFIWQVQWPDDVRNNLQTDQNPTGTLTINDLELAGTILNFLALECQNVNLQYHHLGLFCDNTSAVSWAYRLRTSASSIAAKLLRLLSLRIHLNEASSLIPIHIAGVNNTMADVISRAFKDGTYFKAQHDLTSYFNLNFPLPQTLSWQEFTIPSRLALQVISCLRGTQSPMELLTRPPVIGSNTGIVGVNIPASAASTPSSAMSRLSKPTLSSWPSLQGSGQVFTEEDIKSVFRRSRLHSRPSPRPSNWLENRVQSTVKKESTK